MTNTLARVRSGYRPSAGNATRRMNHSRARPPTTPATRPTLICRTNPPATASTLPAVIPPAANNATIRAMPTGSFAPDSPSRMSPLRPATSRRPSTENTTAGSVGRHRGAQQGGQVPVESERPVRERRPRPPRSGRCRRHRSRRSGPRTAGTVTSPGACRRRTGCTATPPSPRVPPVAPAGSANQGTAGPRRPPRPGTAPAPGHGSVRSTGWTARPTTRPPR